MNSYPNETLIDDCGNVTNVVSSHNPTALNVDAPFDVDLTEFEDNVYIPEMSYSCKSYFSIITCVHINNDCCQCTYSQTTTQTTVLKGLRYKQEQ